MRFELAVGRIHNERYMYDRQFELGGTDLHQKHYVSAFLLLEDFGCL
jgi:hypothetical protein